MKFKFLKFYLISFFLFFFFHFLSFFNAFKNPNFQFAFAIVNIESLRKETQKEDRLHGSLAFDLRKISGNTEKVFLNLKSHLLLKGDHSENLLFLEHRWGQSRKVKDLDKSLIHLRHTRFLSSSFALESYTQMQQNQFTRLNLRALLGLGLRKKFLNRKLSDEQTQRMHLGMGLFYSKEYREKLRKENAFRMNSYLSFSSPLSSSLALKMIVYFQPKVNDIKDYHILEEVSLEVKLNQFISLIFSQMLSFDSQAPKNVRKEDMSLNSSIRLIF